MRYNAPDLKVHRFGDFDGWKSPVVGYEGEVPASGSDAFDGEFAVEVGDDDREGPA